MSQAEAKRILTLAASHRASTIYVNTSGPFTGVQLDVAGAKYTMDSAEQATELADSFYELLGPSTEEAEIPVGDVLCTARQCAHESGTAIRLRFSGNGK